MLCDIPLKFMFDSYLNDNMHSNNTLILNPLGNLAINSLK